MEIEAQLGDTDFADLHPLVAGVRGRECCIDGGDINDGIWTVGQVMGLIDDTPICELLLERMVSEACDILQGHVAAMLN